jgi:hypothetical protein
MLWKLCAVPGTMLHGFVKIHAAHLTKKSSFSPEYIAQVAVQAIASQSNWVGHFSVIEDNRIRMTPLR